MNDYLRDLIDKLKDRLGNPDEKIVSIIVLGILAGFFYGAGAPEKLVILCIIAIAGIAGYEFAYYRLKRKIGK